MSTLHRLLILAPFLLCSCVAQREPLAGTNGIRVEYASQSVIPGLDGYWDAKASTILLRYGAPEYVLAHEIAHGSSSVGSYRTALALVGNPVGLSRQLKIAYEIADHADRLGGTTLAYWKAIHIRYGDSAVQHPEILTAIRMPWLAVRTQK